MRIASPLACSLALVLAALGASATAHADDAPPRVGVVVELAVNLTPERASALSTALADALNKQLVVDALGGDDVARRLPPAGLPDECLGTPTCIQDVATRLEAQQLLFVALVDVGGQVQVDATWIDVASGTSEPRARVTLADDSHAAEDFAVAAPRFLPAATVRTKAPPPTIIMAGGGGDEGPHHRFTLPVWIAGGVAIGAGLGTVLLGLSVRSTYQGCDRRACSDGEIDSLHTRELITDVTLGVTIAAAVTATVFYLRSSTDETTPPARSVTLAPTTGGAVLGVAGHF